ncbi:unnamed protein product [Rhodiola kirilowii]
MAKTPCCDKTEVKKGPWTPEEDKKLIEYIQKHGLTRWRTLSKNAGLKRCGKSCRLRWTNYLRPDIKRGQFSSAEEEAIIQLHSFLGNKWSTIATCIPGRTDNEIKNHWNTYIRKKLFKMGIDPVTHTPRCTIDMTDYSRLLSYLCLIDKYIALFETSWRKRTGNVIIAALIWSAYLLADWFAAFAVGLIANGLSQCEKEAQATEILSFWAPFLLLHLGGPDNITAFSLEDNELWIRHLLGLVIQVVAVAYVSFTDTPQRTDNPNTPHVLVCKTENEAKTSLPELDDTEIVQYGHKFFLTFKGLIVDLMLSFRERNESRGFFLTRTVKEVFGVMEVELNLMYDVLYTKIGIVNDLSGYILRSVSSGCIIVSLVLYHLHVITLHGMHHKQSLDTPISN